MATTRASVFTFGAAFALALLAAACSSQPKVTTACTDATLVALPGSTHDAGTPVVLSASSTGCQAPVYEFYETAPGGTKQLVQTYASGNAFTFQSKTSDALGEYDFEVYVRDAKSTAPFDSMATLAVDLVLPNAADPLAQLAQLPGMCTHDGWCWQWPTPTGNDLQHLFTTGANNVWITGWNLVLQWNGTAWVAHQPPVAADVQASQSAWAIGGTSGSNMYVIYGPNVEYWNGSQWTLAEQGALTGTPNLDNVWVAPDTGDAYVTLSNSTLEQFHQGVKVNTFTAPCGCGLYAIFGTSSHDIFITSVGGEMHFDGAHTWATIGTGATLSGWQGTVNDVWVGGQGALGHWDGTSLTMVPLPASLANQFIFPAAYNRANDIWWYTQNVAGSGGDLFAHWDGIQYTITAPTNADNSSFWPISHALINGKWWFGGTGGSLYTSTDNQTVVPVLPFADSPPNGLWGTSAANLYYAKVASVQHWDGARMSTVASMATMFDFTPLWMDIIGMTGLAGGGTGGADELYVTAQVQITQNPNAQFETVALHYDGQNWTQQVIETNTHDNLVGLGLVSPVGPGEAWAFNAAGTSYHYVSGAWTAVATTQLAQPFTGLWAQDASHVWLVSTNHTLVTWDVSNPSVFTPVQLPAAQCTSSVQPFGAIIGVAGQPWIVSAELCKPDSQAMWELGAGGWTETLNQILGDGNGLHVNPVANAPDPFSPNGVAVLNSTNILYSNIGVTSTWRYNGSVWNPEDDGAQYGASSVFATPDGKSFIAPLTTGLLVHP
jgi:hypothetical protein